MAAFLIIFVRAFAVTEKVKVDVIVGRPKNPKVSIQYEYEAHVTLSIAEDDGTLTPSGWSTRKVFTFSQFHIYSVCAPELH